MPALPFFHPSPHSPFHPPTPPTHSLIHEAAVPPCHHLACKPCWEMLVRASGAHPRCPICKDEVARRNIQESPLFNLMSRALEDGLASFGLYIDDSCNVTDRLQEAVDNLRRQQEGLTDPALRLLARGGPITRRVAASVCSSRPGSSSSSRGSRRRSEEDALDRDAEEEEEEAEEGEDRGRRKHRRREREEEEESSEEEEEEEDEEKEAKQEQQLINMLFASSSSSLGPSDSNNNNNERRKGGGRPPPPLHTITTKSKSTPGVLDSSDTVSSSDDELDSDGEPGGRKRRRPPTHPFKVGDTVEVAPRTWPGINKEGGVGRITAVHPEDGTYDVKYVLVGSKEARVKGKYITDANVLVHPDGNDIQSHGGGVGKVLRATASAAAAGGVGVSTGAGRPSTRATSPPPPLSRKRPAEAMAPAPAATAAAAAARGGGGGGGGGGGTKSSTHKSTAESAARPCKENQRPPSPHPPPPAAAAPAATTKKSKPPTSTSTTTIPIHPTLGDTYQAHPEAIVILPTGLPHHLISKLDEFTERFGGRVTLQPGPDVTHTVGRADGKRRAEQRTMKYLHGLLYRRWLLAPAWVTDSLVKGKVEAELKYELIGDPKANEPSIPHKARLTRYKHTPGLFFPYTFVFYGDFPPPRPTKRDLESLILAGQGRVASVKEMGEDREEEEEEKTWVVIVNSVPASGPRGTPTTIPPTLRRPGLTVINSDWLLDSISNYRTQPFGRYKVVLPLPAAGGGGGGGGGGEGGEEAILVE